LTLSLLGCATNVTPGPAASPAGVAHASAAKAPAKPSSLPLVAVGLHDCESNDGADERTQCQSAVYDPTDCGAAERELRSLDCCARSLVGGASVSFQLIYCERRRPL
jgi:hypothetical protein